MVALTGMAGPLFSQSWYRVEHLCPRLRGHVGVHRHTYRGESWYLLQDHASGRFHRVSVEAYQIVGLMDGRRTLGEIWEAAGARLGDAMLTQDEVISLLSQLHRSDILQTDILPDLNDLGQRSQKGKSSRLLQALRAPLSLKFPLFDPDRLLDAALPLFRPLLGRTGFFLWLAVIVTALFLAGMHWRGLTANLTDNVLALENVILIGMLYPLIKIVHEFAHAAAVKRWGGEVHETGVMLLVLMPIPYVDATASYAFADKRQRMVVSAAGIMAEGFLAALALIVWVNVEPGAVRAAMFNVLLIAGVSTLLFNGNPLLRYDAYYILADWLEIPNFGSRSNRFCGYLLQRYLLGMRDKPAPESRRGEIAWMVGYGVTSFFYRIFISIQIILFVAGRFFVVGVGLALWAGINMLLLPLFRIGRQFMEDQPLREVRSRALLVGGSLVAGLAGLLFLVPLPAMTLVEGVVWVPEKAQVHARANGLITSLPAAPGERVKPGDPLIVCEDPEVATKTRVLQGQLAEYQARYRQAMVSSLTEAKIIGDEVERLEAELDRARERQEDLIIRSPEAGFFLLAQPEDLPGQFVRRGTPLAYVVDFSQIVGRVIVPQEEIELVRARTRGVEVRLAGRFDAVWPARILREVPEATKELPSMALSLEGGGKIALDPQNKETPEAFTKLFQFEIELPPQVVDRVGERLYVRFLHPPEPLAFRWYRQLRRLMLEKFDF